MTYKQGVSLDVSFSIMIGASLLFFINTFALLPVDRIPWPLPLNYGKGEHTDDEKGGHDRKDKGRHNIEEKRGHVNEGFEMEDIKVNGSAKPTRDEILNKASQKGSEINYNL